ncbi:MAG: hypothetical protein ACFFAS_20440 [Promethearchaeota archaeon]
MSITSQVIILKNYRNALATNSFYQDKILIDIYLEALYKDFGGEAFEKRLDEIFLTEFLCALARANREHQAPLCNNDCENCPCEVIVNKLNEGV